MKHKFLWLFLYCLIIFSLVFVSCGTKTTQTTTSTTKPTTAITTTSTISTTTKPTTTSITSTGKWWDIYGKPQYGGTFVGRLQVDPIRWDTYQNPSAAGVDGMYLELLCQNDWTLDPQIWEFNMAYVPPQYRAGCLAESWDVPDLQTVIFHLNKGVHWQDLPPANGREFTADDVVYTFNRQFGLGDGFTEPSPYFKVAQWTPIESVTATDKYTVVFKWKEPTNQMLLTLIETNATVHIINREAVEKWGNLDDWRHAVGTGPWILKDFVSGSSAEFVSNPNYWGYDPRYPENKLPYADTLRFLVIPDQATALAALRTDKIIAITEGIDWETVASLSKTNPGILKATTPREGISLDLRVDKSPFTDIRVRKALQMAVDLETIATTYYGGIVDGIPCGLANPAMKGYYTPYEEWSQQLKNEYAYNPEEAKKLLAEAGYPSGFKTNCVTDTTADQNVMQILKSYLLDIGVDMEIRLMDATSFAAFVNAGKQDQMCSRSRGSVGLPFPPDRLITRRWSQHYTNWTHCNDPVYDKFYADFLATPDMEEQRKLVVQAVDYALAQHWSVNVLPTVRFMVYQPWLKGYGYGGDITRVNWDKCWIDTSIK